MQRGQGGGRIRDICKVECYTCHKKGHLSRNCPQHTWNKPSTSRIPPCPSQGREAIVDDRSVTEEEVNQGNAMTPQQTANVWLRGVANEGDEVRDLVMRDLLGQEDFQSA